MGWRGELELKSHSIDQLGAGTAKPLDVAVGGIGVGGVDIGVEVVAIGVGVGIVVGSFVGGG